MVQCDPAKLNKLQDTWKELQKTSRELQRLQFGAKMAVSTTLCNTSAVPTDSYAISMHSASILVCNLYAFCWHSAYNLSAFLRNRMAFVCNFYASLLAFLTNASAFCLHSSAIPCKSYAFCLQFVCIPRILTLNHLRNYFWYLCYFSNKKQRFSNKKQCLKMVFLILAEAVTQKNVVRCSWRALSGGVFGETFF